MKIRYENCEETYTRCAIIEVAGYWCVIETSLECPDDEFYKMVQRYFGPYSSLFLPEILCYEGEEYTLKAAVAEGNKTVIGRFLSIYFEAWEAEERLIERIKKEIKDREK